MSPNIKAHDAPVLILNYNGWDDTSRLVEHLSNEGHRLWVIDNGSPIARGEQFRSDFPHVSYISLGRNWGWAGGYNRAIQMIRKPEDDCVYILNNDAIPEPGAIDHAVETLRSHPHAAAVGSVLLTNGGASVFYDGKFWYEERSASCLGSGVDLVDRIHGGGFALRLSAFDAVGDFHEPYFLYHEENEWCLRAGRAGYSFYVDLSSRIVHEGGASDTNSNRTYYLVRNRFLAMKRGFPIDDMSTSAGSLIDWDLRASRYLPLEDRRATIDGLIDGVSGKFGQRAKATRSEFSRTFHTWILQIRALPFRTRRRLRSFKHAVTRGRIHRLQSG